MRSAVKIIYHKGRQENKGNWILIESDFFIILINMSKKMFRAIVYSAGLYKVGITIGMPLVEMWHFYT